MASPKEKKRGKFISFEGGEASGKSTQAGLLHDYLESKGIKSILTREVGGTQEAEKIREILLSNPDMSPVAQSCLAFAARFEHIKQLILPALDDGVWVITDRFIDSTACYQGFRMRSGMAGVYKIYDMLSLEAGFEQSLMPDLTFFLSINPARAIERIKTRKVNNSFDAMSEQMHGQIYNNFVAACALFPSRIQKIEIDEKTPSTICREIVKEYLSKYNVPA